MVKELTLKDKRIKYRAWIVLAAATGINLTFGINYSWSIIKKTLVTDWQWTNVDASLPYTVYSTTFALVMVFAGRMQDKMGPRIVVTLGSILVGTGLISCSFTDTLLFMSITYGITGVGYALCFSATMPVCIKWFPPEKRGLIMGIVISGSALASAYFSPIVNALLSHYGIHETFLILGIGIFIVIAGLAQFLDNPPADSKTKSTAAGLSTPAPGISFTTADVDWRGMIRTNLFYKIWLMYFIAASAGLMIVGHIATIAQTQAHWENGFYLVILFAVFNTGGRMIGGFLSDKFGRLKILMAVFIFQAANLLLFGSYTTPTLLALGTIVTGLSYGAAFALFPLATADHYGVKNLGGNYGLVFTAWGFAGLLGPIMAGLAVDTTGTYVYAYMISAVTLFGALILAASITPRVNTDRLNRPTHLRS
jgi:OFA family oxalate/formate antiporter-like MFS transporter